MRRRQFITLLGGAAGVADRSACAAVPGVRRIGVLSALDEDDPDLVTRRPMFEQALRALGWTNGR